jgi:hypothetical protein
MLNVAFLEEEKENKQTPHVYIALYWLERRSVQVL